MLYSLSISNCATPLKPKYNKGLYIYNFSKEIETSMIEYGHTINLESSIPSIVDGLKPVHRHILLALSKDLKTSAFTVGSCVAKYHPVGDASVYEALVEMTQEWKNTIPLATSIGNMGNISGDSPAAMRYPKSGINKKYEDLAFGNLNVVNHVWNYDDSIKIPEYLNSRYPIALINGTMGIGYATATKIPSFNINDLNQIIIDILEEKESSKVDIVSPTGSEMFILSGDPLHDYNFKYGSRAKFTIDDRTITFSNIPYGTKADNIKDQILELALNYVLSGKNKIQKETDKNILQLKDVTVKGYKDDPKKVDIVVELQHKANINTELNKLFKYTDLETISTSNIQFIDKNRGKHLSVYQALKLFVDYKLEFKKVELSRAINKSEEQQEYLAGLHRCLSSKTFFQELLDDGDLQTKYELSDTTYEILMSKNIKYLKGMSVSKVSVELDKEVTKKNKLKDDLTNIRQVLADEYKGYKYQEVVSNMVEEPKPFNEELKDVLIYSYDNGTVSMNYDNLKVKNKGTQGKSIKTTNKIVSLYEGTNKDTVLMISNKGTVFKYMTESLDEVPTRLDKLPEDEYIKSIVPYKENTDYLMVSDDKIARIKNDVFTNIRAKSPFITDNLLRVLPISEEDKQVILVTKDHIVNIELSSINAKTKTRGFITRGDIIDMCIPKDDKAILLTKNGKGRLVDTSTYTVVKSIKSKGIKAFKNKEYELIGCTSNNYLLTEGDSLVSKIKLDKVAIKTKNAKSIYTLVDGNINNIL
jgi:DNA gyrase subunit A